MEQHDQQQVSNECCRSDRLDTKGETCHVTLFANGIILVMFHGNKDSETIRAESRTSFKMFSLTGNSHCRASPKDNHFYVLVDELTECRSKKDCVKDNDRNEEKKCSLLLGVDIDGGGSVMDAYKWMTEMEECVAFLSDVEKVKEQVMQQSWHTT